MFGFWYKGFPHYPLGHQDYWRVRLIYHTLLITTAYFLILTTINVVYFDGPGFTLIDAVGFFISIGIYIWFRQTGNLEGAAWVVTLMVAILVCLFVFSVHGEAHSLMWITIIPPLAFFLIGRHWGAVISGGAFLFTALVVYEQIQQQRAFSFGIGALLNVIEVSIAHILLFRFYEGTRSLAFKQLSLKNAEIQKLAETDKLTGLYNRDKLDSSLVTMLSDARRLNHAVTLLIIDIDYFKRINDQYGHLFGDQVLMRFSHYLRRQMRNNDLLARWGGEEFVMVLPDTDMAMALTIAERLRSCIAKQEIEGKYLTISIGVAQYDVTESVGTLLDRADQALYQAKQQGRNRVVAT